MSRPQSISLDALHKACAQDLRVIGGTLDKIDQLDLLPMDEMGSAFQALVNLQHWLRVAEEQA